MGGIPRRTFLRKQPLPARERARLLAEISRIDETITDIELCYAKPGDPILLGTIQIATRGDTVALLKRYRRQLERRVAA